MSKPVALPSVERGKLILRRLWNEVRARSGAGAARPGNRRHDRGRARAKKIAPQTKNSHYA